MNFALKAATKCHVNGCQKTKRCFAKLFPIPRTEKTRNKWLEFLISSGLKIEDPTMQYFVCEKHFEKKLIISYLHKTRLVPDAVPTILVNKNLK